MAARGLKEPSALAFSVLCDLFDDLHDHKGKARDKVTRFIRNNIRDGAADAFQVIRLLLPKVGPERYLLCTRVAPN